MQKASLIVCFLLALTGYCAIPPSPDFNITDFVGNWNVVGLFSTTNLGVTFYSCATLNVTLGTLSRLTLALNYIDTLNNSYVQTSETVVPSPLNKAILISTTSPVPENNFVVTYYNQTGGEAVMINSALTHGYVLSRSENPFANNLVSTASQIFTSLSLPLTNLTFIFNRGCDIQNLKPVTSPQSLAGNFYGNAVWTSVPVLQDLECFQLNIENVNNQVNVTINLTYTSGRVIYTALTYYSLPQEPNVLTSTQIKNLPPLVVILADTTNNVYVAASGDGTKAFVFSTQPTLSQNALSEVEQALNQNGLIITSSTFYQMPTTCVFSWNSIFY